MTTKRLSCFLIDEPNHGRILSKLIAEGIFVERAEKCGRGLLVYCLKKQSSNIIALFDRMCYNYKSVEYESFWDRIFRRIKSGGVLFAVVAYVAFVLFSDGFVFKVAVDAPSVTEYEVRQTLKKAGIDLSGRITASEKQMEDALVAGIEKVSFASVKKTGNRLDVKLAESLDGETFFDFDKAEIRSLKNALVTRVIVWSGTAECESGRAVKTGDLLIGGYTLVGDEKIACAASGEVYGICYFTAEVGYFSDQKQLCYTGRSVKKTYLNFFGSVKFDFKPEFENYDTVVKKRTVGIFLPYEYVTVEFRETEYRLPEYGFETVREQLESQATALAVSQVPPSATVRGGRTEIKKTQDGYVVRAVVEAEMRIDVG